MNNKGQMLGVGIIIMIAITAIVGLVLMIESAQQVGSTTDEIVATNIPQTVVNATAVNIPGKFWTGLVVRTINGTVIPATNYSLANNQVINGGETSTLTNLNQDGRFFLAWNLTGVYQPDTYITSGGSRSIAGLITIFFALAIALVMLLPTLQGKLADFMR